MVELCKANCRALTVCLGFFVASRALDSGLKILYLHAETGGWILHMHVFYHALCRYFKKDKAVRLNRHPSISRITTLLLSCLFLSFPVRGQSGGSAPPQIIVQFEDLDGDGVVTPLERSIQVYRDVQQFSEAYQLQQNPDLQALLDDMLAYTHALFGDLNGDGIVDALDILYLLENVDVVSPTLLQSDLNGNGVVGAADLSTLMSATGTVINLTEEQMAEGLVDILNIVVLETAPGGSFSMNPALPNPFLSNCCEWAATQNMNMNWITTLPPCPCSIGVPAVNPNPAVWHNPSSGGELDIFHPGETYDMRSIPTVSGWPGQQCTYDAFGNLITDGIGAGTPDRVSPGGFFNALRHFAMDVMPWFNCDSEGRLCLHLLVRPPNNGNGCPINAPVPPPSCEECLFGF